MAFESHLTEFAGLPSVAYLSPESLVHQAEQARRAAKRAGSPVPDALAPDPAMTAALAAPGSVAWRLDQEYWDEADDQPLGYFTRFTEDVDTSKVAAVVIGNSMPGFEGEENEPIMRALVAIAPRLPALRALFYADVTYQECEASWLTQGDMAPVLAAFPSLEEFAVRGTGRLDLHVPEHARLRRLTLQGGGLPAALARQVAASGLPALEHLELWLGRRDYDGDTVPADLEPVLSGRAFPRLRSLGLRNGEDPGVWIRALADAPVTPTLHTLDLSLGALRDEDAAALLDASALRSLRRLDLHHHYLSEEMEQRVRETFAGVEVDLSQRMEPDDDRHGEPLYFTAVGE